MHDGEFLRKYIKTKPIKVTKVVELTGIQRPTVYTHFNKEKIDSLTKLLYSEKIGIDWNRHSVEKIRQSDTFSDSSPPDVNEGYKTNSTYANASPIYQEVIEVPIVEKRARAGYARGFADPEYMETLRKVFVAKQYEKGNYLAFEIDGNSMDDGLKHAICNGDVLLCKELDRIFWHQKLFISKYLFVIVTDEDVVCKEIVSHDVSTGDIVCHSFNPAYNDFKLNLSEVNQLFYAVKVVERDISI